MRQKTLVDITSPLLRNGVIERGHHSYIRLLMIQDLEKRLEECEGINILLVLEAILQLKEMERSKQYQEDLTELRGTVAKLKNKYRAEIKRERDKLVQDLPRLLSTQHDV